MFELIIKLADLLLKGGKAYEERRMAERRKEFGKCLVMCYLRLVEIIAVGNKIVATLKQIESSFHADFSYFSIDLSDVGRYLRRQSINLNRLRGSLDDIVIELRVIAPDVAEEIAFLCDVKKGRVKDLERNLSLHVFNYGQQYDIGSRLKVDGPLTIKETESFIEYLRSGQPQSLLEKLRKNAEELRGLITNSFELDEVLFGVDSYKEDFRD